MSSVQSEGGYAKIGKKKAILSPVRRQRRNTIKIKRNKLGGEMLEGRGPQYRSNINLRVKKRGKSVFKMRGSKMIRPSTVLKKMTQNRIKKQGKPQVKLFKKRNL